MVFTSNLSGRFEEIQNPFTGELSNQPVGESVTDEERLAILGVIEPVKEFGPDEIGSYGVKFPDGSSLELFFDDLETSGAFRTGMLALRQYSIEITEFIYQLAKVGNLVIQIGPESNGVVMSDVVAQRVGGRWESITVVGSPANLHILIESSFNDWAAYRDRVRDELGE
tara:strand:- start:133 stop:639 length:507 start_codon:yes stop_codon:yes gene_type:complete